MAPRTVKEPSRPSSRRKTGHSVAFAADQIRRLCQHHRRSADPDVTALSTVVFLALTVAVFALLGYLKVRRIRGPQKTIESVKEIPEAFGPDKPAKAVATTDGKPATDPSGW